MELDPMFDDWLNLQRAVTKLQIKKTGQAQYGRYVTLAEVLDQILPLLNQFNFILTQAVGYEANQPILITVVTHASGKTIESKMLLMLKSPDPQSQGSAITYARRYSLMALLGLVGDDDDGAAAQRSATEQVNASDKQRGYIAKLMDDNGVAKNDQLNAISDILGSEFSGRLSSADANTVIEALKSGYGKTSTEFETSDEPFE